MIPSFEKMCFEYRMIPRYVAENWKKQSNLIVNYLRSYHKVIISSPKTPIVFDPKMIEDVYNLLKDVYPYVPMLRNCPNMGFNIPTFETVTHKIPWIYQRNVLSQNYDEFDRDKFKFIGFSLYSDVMFEITSTSIRSYEAKNTPLNTFLAEHIDRFSYWIESTIDLVAKGPENIMSCTCLSEIVSLASSSDTIWREISLSLYDTVNALIAVWVNNDERAQQAYIATKLVYDEKVKKNWTDIRNMLQMFIDCYQSQSTNRSLPIDSQFLVEIAN